jgi:hypothetical protein
MPRNWETGEQMTVGNLKRKGWVKFDLILVIDDDYIPVLKHYAVKKHVRTDMKLYSLLISARSE